MLKEITGVLKKIVLERDEDNQPLKPEFNDFICVVIIDDGGEYLQKYRLSVYNHDVFTLLGAINKNITITYEAIWYEFVVEDIKIKIDHFIKERN